MFSRTLKLGLLKRSVYIPRIVICCTGSLRSIVLCVILAVIEQRSSLPHNVNCNQNGRSTIIAADEEFPRSMVKEIYKGEQ